MKITKEQKEFIENRKNTFVANDWFDINFFGRFLNSDLPIKKHFNAQTYSISEENISSRVLNHWYEMGIIDDDRLNGKGWKRLSMSEIVWIHIINKLRGFGLDLKRIKEVKNQIDLYSSKDNISKSPLLDFYMAVAITSSIPIKLIVFEGSSFSEGYCCKVNSINKEVKEYRTVNGIVPKLSDELYKSFTNDSSICQ